MSTRYLIILSIIINSFPLFGQNLASPDLAFADSQYLSGNYKLAVKEYQRVLFFSDSLRPDVLLRLANAEYYCNNWEAARNYYDQVYRLSSNDSIKIDAKLQKISTYISELKYKQALIDLFNIDDSIYKTNSFYIDALFGICYFGLEDFDKSKEYFIKAAGKDEIAAHKIDSIFSDEKRFVHPNPATAGVLSMILPGLGQMYSGHVAEGLNSFFLTETLLVVAVIVAYQYTFIDAVMTIIPWYQRYFIGGVGKAKDLAISKRKMNQSQAYQEVIKILEEKDR